MRIARAGVSPFRTALAGLIVAGGATAAAGPATATGDATVIACGARAQLVALLESRYGEVFSGETYEAEQGKLELFVAHTGSWTMLLTFPTGRSCPVAIGADAERDLNRSDLVGTPI